MVIRTPCGQVGPSAVGQGVTVCGWVHRRRDHGGLTFIDVRDRSGILQVVFNPQGQTAAHTAARELRAEYVVQVTGVVRTRPAGTENPKLATGAVELEATAVTVLNPSATPPFELVEEGTEAAEELRYTYRYLDLRRPVMQERLRVRHQALRVIREFLDREGFLEVETPILTKSTPEGARDYLVPSRLNPGLFYALPQSPQLFKQLLMVAGVERYYQIARCFRDEDLRADRQPEFTQLDLELSFVDEEQIFHLMERLFHELFRQALGMGLTIPFPRLSYAEAVRRFGTDKPDLRYGLELADVSTCFAETGFERFRSVLAAGGVIQAIAVPGGGVVGTKEVDRLTEMAKRWGAQGLVSIRVTPPPPAGGTGRSSAAGGREAPAGPSAGGGGVTPQELASPVAKHVGQPTLRRVVEATHAAPGDLILLVADQPAVAREVLDRLRRHLAESLQLIPANRWDFVWILDFPLFTFNTETHRWDSAHHPFTAPREQDLPRLGSDPGAVRARSYDLVVNGFELGSGSIRIHSREVQQQIFRILGMSEPEQQQRFGFLLEAFQYGAPPHGGIAFGIDRLAALVAGSATIREVIAFPKTQKAVDLMTGAPGAVRPEQLRELGISVQTRPVTPAKANRCQAPSVPDT